MNFKELLEDAKTNPDSVERLVEMYQNILSKKAIVAGVFNEDLYQENIIVLIRCIHSFQI